MMAMYDDTQTCITAFRSSHVCAHLFATILDPGLFLVPGNGTCTPKVARCVKLVPGGSIAVSKVRVWILIRLISLVSQAMDTSIIRSATFDGIRMCFQRSENVRRKPDVPREILNVADVSGTSLHPKLIARIQAVTAASTCHHEKSATLAEPICRPMKRAGRSKYQAPILVRLPALFSIATFGPT